MDKVTRIVFATQNKDKLREIKRILDREGLDTEVLSMEEAGIAEDVEETGTTFAENAVIKAEAVYSALTGRGSDICETVVLADDSGLVIDALGGEPGIMSARYLGHDTPYPEKNARILGRMKDVPEEERSARFVCAIAAVMKGDQGTDKLLTKTWTGTMEGRIAWKIQGENGFGYDPIFFLPEYGCTSAELSEDDKNAISHRGKALRACVAWLAGMNGGKQ